MITIDLLTSWAPHEQRHPKNVKKVLSQLEVQSAYSGHLECSSGSVEFFLFLGILEVWWNFRQIWWNLAKYIDYKKVPSLEVEQLKKFHGTTGTLF